MKNFLLFTLLALLGTFSLQAQIVYEDFEGGTADLPWVALEGTYNGVIANPDKNALNPSDYVGSYTKAAGVGYSLFWAIDLDPLDLSEYSQFKLKVWCSTATPVLLKFEGPGQAVEQKVDMPVAGAWNELSFDLSAGASLSQLTKIIIFFDPGNDPSSNTYYFDDLVAYKAERCYETFEPAADITWTGLNGSFNGAIANPGPNQVNSTATVGSFTNNPNFDYNFAFGTLAAPMDLKTYNQFSMDVWLPKAAKVLFKLEGTGQAKEVIKYVPVSNAWQRVNFDMSAADTFSTITKVLIVFNPGTLNDTATYYFDNICAVPNLCKGATKDPNILDDFECNRNAAYSVGWDSLFVIKNPGPDGGNASSKVGEWHPVTGSSYSALVIAQADPIDLTTRNQFGMKVWSPKTGNLLLKIEGGNGPKEISVPMTETNKWVEYSVDFSDQVGKGHTKLVAFFNAGVDAEPGDIYYFDDVKLAAPPTAPPLEDFEGMVHLGWQALDQNEPVHGVFTGPTPNPSPNSVNNSAEVGCYAKGSSGFSTLQAISLTNFNLSVYPQFNLDVLSPAGGGKVVMQLNSPTQGNKEAEATISTPGEWETLGFDFSAFDAITDFGEIRLIFNPGTAASGESWCIDNLRQSEVNVDPCKDVLPVPNIVSDFECQNNYTTIFYGANDLKVVNNPHVTTANGSTKVGEYTDPANEPYAGIGYRFAQPVDLSVANQLKFKVYSPIPNVPFLIKLQGGQQVEIFDTLTTANEWHQFSIDFTSGLGKGNTELVIFFNVASDQGGQIYYVDDIRWSRANYNGCVSDYETPASSFSNFTYFNNGSGNYTFETVDNPLPAGGNTSAKVGKFVEAPDAGIYFGMFADLEAFVDFKGTKTIKMKVLMDHIGTVTAKTEIFGNAIPPVEVTVSNTKVNEWEELTFDFSNAPDMPGHNRFTLFFDIATTGTGSEVVSYFDDIVIGAGQCGVSSVFQPLSLEAMKVSPNPVTDFLRVDNFQNVSRMEVFNMLGRRVATLNTGGDLRTEIDVTRFAPGMYQLTGYDAKGQAIGYAKFVKQ